MAKHFNPKRFPIVFAGVQMQGFSESNMAAFEFDTESVSDVVGVDGEVSRSLNLDRRAKLSVYLMSTSSTNDLLSAIYVKQRLSENGEDVGALRVEDLNGRLVIDGPESWIMDTPKPTWGKTASEYLWVLRIANANAFFGGNS